jgi:hypothetical protein
MEIELGYAINSLTDTKRHPKPPSP